MKKILLFTYINDNKERINYLLNLKETLKKYGFDLKTIKRETIEKKAQDSPGKTNKWFYALISKIIVHLFSLSKELEGSVERYIKASSDAKRDILLQFYEYRKQLKKDNPSYVLLWHQFNSLHYLFYHYLKKRKIKYGFIHMGSLPGTIAIDKDGEMGESWIANDIKSFQKLGLNNSMLYRTKKYLDYIEKERIDRKPETEEGQIDLLIKKIKGEGKKIIFFAGQFDRNAGLVPYDENAQKYHSPYFNSSIDALKYLDLISQNENWVIIYKPHPSDSHNVPIPGELTNTYVVSGANIFDCIYLSDVTVTVLSATSYLARIHDRPVVMLGRHQLTGKECVYEVNAREDTKNKILTAISNGHTEQMNENWIYHAARMMFYYLFSFDKNVENIIGRGIEDAAAYVNSIIQDQIS